MKKSAPRLPWRRLVVRGGKEAQARKIPNHKYVLQLYVAGSTARSAQAIANLRSVCDAYLKGCHELEVVDIFQQPERAILNQIVAVPTLLKTLPAPSRCLVGDLSDRRSMLAALGLKEPDPTIS